LGSQVTREPVTREPGSHCGAITEPSPRAIPFFLRKGPIQQSVYSHGGRTREQRDTMASQTSSGLIACSIHYVVRLHNPSGGRKGLRSFYTIMVSVSKGHYFACQRGILFIIALMARMKLWICARSMRYFCHLLCLLTLLPLLVRSSIHQHSFGLKLMLPVLHIHAL